MRTSSEEKAWMDELDRAFPDRVLLSRTDIAKVFGTKRTRTATVLAELKLPEIVIGEKKKLYRKSDLAKALSRKTERVY